LLTAAPITGAVRFFETPPLRSHSNDASGMEKKA
jgi:hypothetical protein